MADRQPARSVDNGAGPGYVLAGVVVDFFRGLGTGLTSTTRRFAAGASFLLVEDDAVIAMMTELMLADAGADDIVIAGSVANAMALVASRAFDVAIFDRQLGDGISYPAAVEACRKGTAIIVATGSHGLDLPAELAEAIVLPKPFALTQLEHAVTQARALVSTQASSRQSRS